MQHGTQHVENGNGQAINAGAYKGATPMKSYTLCAIAVVILAGMSFAKELPEAPSSSIMQPVPVVAVSPVTPVIKADAKQTKIVDLKFSSLALISTGSTFADSYTTLFARQNYLAGKTGVCNMEVQSAYLYGTHPTVGRAYAVASFKSVGAVAAAYYLRKHHSKFWSAPLVANSLISLEGVTQNMRACN
jgi:hypothetical protein